MCGKSLDLPAPVELDGLWIIRWYLHPNIIKSFIWKYDLGSGRDATLSERTSIAQDHLPEIHAKPKRCGIGRGPISHSILPGNI
jgi:hypothetical protein